MPNNRHDNDYAEDGITDIDYIDEKRAKQFVDEPIELWGEDDKRAHKLQLAHDKEHPAHGLDNKVDEDD